MPILQKNIVKVWVQGAKGVKSNVLGVQTDTEPGIFSIKMKIVEDTKKHYKQRWKHTVNND